MSLLCAGEKVESRLLEHVSSSDLFGLDSSAHH